MSAYRGLCVLQLHLPLTRSLIVPFPAVFGVLCSPLCSYYRELRGVKYCFAASDEPARGTEQGIPPERVECIFVGGLSWGPGNGKEGPCGRAGPCPLMSLLDRRPRACDPRVAGSWQRSPANPAVPTHPPTKAGPPPSLFGREVAFLPKLGFTPVSDFSSRLRAGDDATSFVPSGCWRFLSRLLQLCFFSSSQAWSSHKSAADPQQTHRHSAAG